MKKFALLPLCLLLSLALALPAAAAGECTTIVLKIGCPFICVNGTERPIDDTGAAPVVENGSTLVPLRAVFESLSAQVVWDDATQTVTGTRGDTELRLTIGDKTAYRNNVPVRLDAAPRIVGGRTLVPLRFIAEGLGADVSWDGGTQTVVITQPAGQAAPSRAAGDFLTLGAFTVQIGDTLAQVESVWGKADRIDPSQYDFNWHVYRSDYSRFIMIGVKNGFVEGLYSNSKGFITNGAAYGDTAAPKRSGVTHYYDPYDGGRLYACLIISPYALPRDGGEDLRAQELQNFDATNAFRVSHGQQPLLWDDQAAATARRHSQDMADRRYFSHTTPEGLQAKDRFTNDGGTCGGWSENLSAGRLWGVDAFHDLVNSEAHRTNLLCARQYLGVGYGYNAKSPYRYYMTQFFFS